jgi:outer membrane protein assembly factor BamB
MKKYNVIIYLLSIILCSSKCKEEAIKPLPYKNLWEHPTPALDTLWTAPIGFGITPKFTSNKDVLMSSRYTNLEGEIFKLFDGNTGKLKWQWADYFKVEENFGGGKNIEINNALILCSGNCTYALNMHTGQTLWKHQMDSMSGSPQIYKDEDGYVYHGFSSKTKNSTYYIYRTKYTEPKWELVCTFSDTILVDRVLGTSIACSQNAKGEKIMVFTLYMDYTINGQLKTISKVCGYNLNTKQFEWKRDYTDKYSEFRVCKMLNVENKVYTFAINSKNGGFAELIAIDVNGGTIIWNKDLPEYGSSLFLYKNNIIILSDNSSNTSECTALSLDQNTGASVWESKFASLNNLGLTPINFTSFDATVFKNYLFSTQCDNLLVLNLDNGAIVFNKPVSLPNGCLQYGVAINEQKRCFYVQDRNKAICYKLPEEVKY